MGTALIYPFDATSIRDAGSAMAALNIGTATPVLWVVGSRGFVAKIQS